MRRIAGLAALLALGGCATARPSPEPPASAELPMHDMTSADLPREIAQTAAGTLRRHGTCVMAVGLGLSEGRTIVPIWPRGTRSEGADVLLPNGNPLRIGKKAGFRGRYADEDEQEFGAIASACGGEAFLVESGNRMYVWGTAAELVEMSDAVLRVRVSGINPRDPGPMEC